MMHKEIIFYDKDYAFSTDTNEMSAGEVDGIFHRSPVK
jgi:hypothetical protein